MAKLTLNDLASLTNEQSAISLINANNALIETAIENTVSRDGTTPNTLSEDLDVNSNHILNLPVPTDDTSPVRKAEFDAAVSGIDITVGITDIALPSGGTIFWDTDDVVITHSANALAFTGASSGYSLDANLTMPVSTGVSWAGGTASIKASSTGTGVNFVGTTGFRPATNDTAALGTSALSWSDLFLASGAVINFNNSDVTITHSADTLTFAGLTNLNISGTVSPTVNDGGALGSGSFMWSDLFLASGSVINFNNDDVTVTHSADTLTIAGLASGLVLSGPAGATPVLNISGRERINGLSGDTSAVLEMIPFGVAGCYFYANTSREFTFQSAALVPSANDGVVLGSTSLSWSDLFLASGGVINWNNGDVTITHSSNTLTFAGASTAYSFDAPVTSTSGATWYSGTAVPAGGTTGTGVKMSSTSNLGIFFGSGAPTLSAAQGSLYIRTDGSSTSSRLYVNTNGSTTWANFTTSS